MKKKSFIALTLCAVCGVSSIAQPIGASKPELLLKYEHGLMAPVWSPTGDRIAVTTDNYTGILVADANGSNLMPLTQEAGAGYKMCWSNDGSMILGRTNVEENRLILHEVKVWNVNNGSSRTIIEKTREITGTPLWENAGNVAVAYRSGIKSFNLKTSKERILSQSNVYSIMVNDPANAACKISSLKEFEGKIIINPSISADNSTIAFQIPGKGIYTCTADGSQVKFICKGSHPTWLPDGKTIVYTVVSDDGSRFTESHLFAINTTTMKSVELVGGSDIIPLTPAVSPDGKKVAFENAADAAIYVISLKY